MNKETFELYYVQQWKSLYFDTAEQANSKFKAVPIRGKITKYDVITKEGVRHVVEIDGPSKPVAKKAIKSEYRMPLDTVNKLQVNVVRVKEHKGKLEYDCSNIDVRNLEGYLIADFTPEKITITTKHGNHINGPAINILNFLFNTGTIIEIAKWNREEEEVVWTEYVHPNPIQLKKYVYATHYGLTPNARRAITHSCKLVGDILTFTWDDLRTYNNSVSTQVKANNRRGWNDTKFYDILADNYFKCTFNKEATKKQLWADRYFNAKHNGFSITDDEQADIDAYHSLFGINDNTVTICDRHIQCDDGSVYVKREISETRLVPNYSFSNNGVKYAGNEDGTDNSLSYASGSYLEYTNYDEDGNDDVEDTTTNYKTLYTDMHDMKTAEVGRKTLELMNWYQFLNVTDSRYTVCKCGAVTRADRAVCDTCKEFTLQALKDIQDSIAIIEAEYAEVEKLAKRNNCRIFDQASSHRYLYKTIGSLPTDAYKDLYYNGVTFEYKPVLDDCQFNEDINGGEVEVEDESF